MPRRASNVCEWCKTVYVVDSLARACEDSHLEDE